MQDVRTEKLEVVSMKKIKLGVLKSVRSKLIALGGTAIVVTAILGGTGIQSLRSNNANSRVLESINKIKLLQNNNQTAEISFLYSMDTSYNDTIMKNLDTIQESAESAKKSANSKVKKNLETISSDTAKMKENMSTFASLAEKRSFSEEQGLYADFAAQDDVLQEQFNKMSEESEWIDGNWIENHTSSLKKVKIDGKTYRKYTYTQSLKEVSKRNYVVVRLGGDQVTFKGKVIVNNICLDGSEKIDLSELTLEDLSKSYGDAYENLAVETAGGEASITYDAKYHGNGSWEEASIEIPIAEYAVQDAKKITYDMYLEDTGESPFKAAIAFNEKYNFKANLETLQKDFDAYSKKVAEGVTDSELLDAIHSVMDSIKANAATYVLNEEVISAVTEAMDTKQSIFADIVAADEEIVKVKSDNNAVDEQLLECSNKVASEIEESTESTRIRMLGIIAIVFFAGLIITILLTMFVLASVQKSIKNFKGTLKDITDGDMTVKVKTGSGDEFDQFGQSLNGMTDKLTEVLSSVLHAGSDIQTSGSDLKKIAQQTSDTSGRIDASITEIAQGAADQADDVESATAQIARLGELVGDMVTNVEDLDHTSKDMNAAGNEAMHILGELSNYNEKMTDGIGKIANQIGTTNKAVTEIGEAVSLISTIAEQTNLLSLNASIEAARAGEAGKGFAVVASEIQQLADQSNQSANTIAEVINVLTKEFQQTMEVMDEVESSTREQNKKLAETQNHFHIVDDGIKQSREKTTIIKHSIEECDKVRVIVNELILNLSAISEENAASTTETAESMRILNETMEELLQSSDKLMTISTQLESEMQFFKL